MLHAPDPKKLMEQKSRRKLENQNTLLNPHPISPPSSPPLHPSPLEIPGGAGHLELFGLNVIVSILKVVFLFYF